jgi:hypothetical protein
MPRLDPTEDQHRKEQARKDYPADDEQYKEERKQHQRVVRQMHRQWCSKQLVTGRLDPIPWMSVRTFQVPLV